MINNNIIVVDDDKTIRTILTSALSRSGFNVKSSGTTAGLWRLIETEQTDVLITDVGLPDGDVLDILPKLNKQKPNLKIIVISAKSTLITAVRAEKKGAFHYLPKPFDIDEVIELVTRVIHSKNTDKSNLKEYFTNQHSANFYETGPVIGKSTVMQQTYKLIARLVDSNLPVLITGETGTGKKLIARFKHDLSERQSTPFVRLTMNDFRINDKNSSYENFSMDLKNKLSTLNGGTLFIDEIGESDFVQQTELLTFLENENFLNMTNNKIEQHEPRVIASTRSDIQELIKRGNFREDLFYKLNVVPIYLPPLRDRLEDIPELLNHFMKIFSNSSHDLKQITDQGLGFLKDLDWPGNVQELKNFAERLNLITSEKIINVDVIKNSLSFHVPNMSNDSPFNSIDLYLSNYIDNYFSELSEEVTHDHYQYFIKKIEKPLIYSTLKYTKGNQIKAAKMLGFNRNTLRKKINYLDIDYKKIRKNSI